MDLKQGATVSNAAGEKVGHVDRVVLDPITKEVSHIVVRKGLLLKEDKVVPVSLIASAQGDQVVLRESANGLEDLPLFEEKHYIPVHETELRRQSPQPDFASPLYPYPATGGVPLALVYPPEPEFVVQTERNIPEGAVALKVGAKVISADDKHMGNVERVLTDPQNDRITHLLISKGLLLKERKLVPTIWIKGVSDESVHLAVGSQTLDELREYMEPD